MAANTTARVLVIGIGLVAAAFPAACAPAQVPAVSAGFSVAATCPERSSANYFLTAESIGAPATVADRWLLPTYSQLLALINAEPLWCGEMIDEAYRLMVLPPFEPPIVVELVRDERKWLIRTATYSGVIELQRADGFKPSVKQLAQRAVDINSVADLFEHLDRTRYWSTPSFKSSGTSDATALTIEGRRGGSYRAVTRLTGENDALEESARIFLNIAGVGLPRALKEKS
jgi:hypothetical protein